MPYRTIKHCHKCAVKFVSYSPNGKRCDPCRIGHGDTNKAERARKDAILDLFDRTCVYCGLEADVVDHLTPRALGGSDDPENLVAACRRCNASKGKLLLDERLWGNVM